MEEYVAYIEEGRNRRSVSFHSAAVLISESHGKTEASQFCRAVALGLQDALVGMSLWESSPQQHYRHGDLDRMKDSYARWQMAFSNQLSPNESAVLGAVNRLSVTEDDDAVMTLRVSSEDVCRQIGDASLDDERIREILRQLRDKGLINFHPTMGRTQGQSTYIGVARLERSQVVNDREIDDLRQSGESDTLDFKRTIDLGSSAKNFEFAKDVTALSNAGGIGPRFLLAGVEDNGVFFAPPDSNEAADHQSSLDDLQETRLQQIVAQRTLSTPSIRVARGHHRFGSYVLIEITRDERNLAYYVFSDPADRLAPDAEKRGEVWIQKGSIKVKATPQEIEALRTRSEIAAGLI
jgi:hypothetical protein